MTDIQCSKRVAYNCQEYWYIHNQCGIVRSEGNIQPQRQQIDNKIGRHKRSLTFDSFDTFNRYNTLWYSLYHPHLICHVNVIRSSYHICSLDSLCLETKIHLPSNVVCMRDWLDNRLLSHDTVWNIMKQVLSVFEYLHVNEISCGGLIDIDSLLIVPDSEHVYVQLCEEVKWYSKDIESYHWKDIWSLILLNLRLIHGVDFIGGVIDSKTSAYEIVQHVDDQSFWYSDQRRNTSSSSTCEVDFTSSRFMSVVHAYVLAQWESFDCLVFWLYGDIHLHADSPTVLRTSYICSLDRVDLLYCLYVELDNFYKLHSVTFDSDVLVYEVNQMFQLHEIYADVLQVFVILQHIWTSLQYCQDIQMKMKDIHTIQVCPKIRSIYENPFVRLHV